jgi:hypothetical protein
LNVGVLKDQARQENADSYVMAAEISNNRSCDVAKGLSSALGVAKKHENGGRLVFEKRPGSHVHCIWDFLNLSIAIPCPMDDFEKTEAEEHIGFAQPILEKKQTFSSGISDFGIKPESMIVGKYRGGELYMKFCGLLAIIPLYYSYF